MCSNVPNKTVCLQCLYRQVVEYKCRRGGDMQCIVLPWQVQLLNEWMVSSMLSD